MLFVPQPLPDDREEAAVEVLRRIHQCKFGVPIIPDPNMYVFYSDREIAAFIRKFGPFAVNPPSD